MPLKNKKAGGGLGEGAARQFQTPLSHLSPGPLPPACLFVGLSVIIDYWESFSHRAAFRNLHCHLSMFSFYGASTTFPHVSVSPLIGPSHCSFQSNACGSVDAIGCSQSMSNIFIL